MMIRTFAGIVLFCCCILAQASPIATLSKGKNGAAPLSDAAINTAVMAKFAANDTLRPLKIKVSTRKGVVTLLGVVKNRETFINALRLTKMTEGVRSVDADDLDIRQVNNSLTDAYITAKVETAVLRAKVFDDESIPLVGINASTTNGTVTLSGNVKKNKSIVAIIKRVNAIHGVKNIISRLQVRKEDV